MHPRHTPLFDPAKIEKISITIGPVLIIFLPKK